MDVHSNISAPSGAAGYAQKDGEYLNLSLSLSIGSSSQEPPPRPDQLLPGDSNPLGLGPPSPPHFFVMPSDGSSTSPWPFTTPISQWPFTTPISQWPRVVQIPQLQRDMPVQILQPLGEEPSSSNAAVFHSPRQRSRVGGAAGALSRKKKAETVTPPYPWATDRRAMIHSYAYLMSKGLRRIGGEVQCKRCERKYEVQYDLAEKFGELWDYIVTNRSEMHDRAPDCWTNPALPDCSHCEQAGCVKPVPTKKKSINWLFLLLGQLLGCCKLSELKYFCKHTSNHRTGAKDRVLYLTYMGLCHQLDPTGPFQM